MSSRTRRDWLVTITQAAAGMSLVEKVAGGAEHTAPLPPGVYEPSTDHLGHALMSAERYHPIPVGCLTDYVAPASQPFEPLFFSKPEFEVICRLIRLLLTEDSDRASVIREIAEWIDLRVSDAPAIVAAEARVDPLYRALATAYYGPKVNIAPKPTPRALCNAGLEWLFSTAQAKYSKDFMALELEQQVTLLQLMSDDRTDHQDENQGTRFFTFLKGETIHGFYTSRIGLQELDFKGNAFYARSPGCRVR